MSHAELKTFVTRVFESISNETGAKAISATGIFICTSTLHNSTWLSPFPMKPVPKLSHPNRIINGSYLQLVFMKTGA